MTLWFDIPKLLDAEPRAGDYLVSRGKDGKVGSAYLILRARGVRRRKQDAEHRRYMLEVERQRAATAEIQLLAKWWLCWNPRVKVAPPQFLGFRDVREAARKTFFPDLPKESLDPRFSKPRRVRR